MTRDEWYRLKGYWLAQRNRPTWNHLSKRHIKGNAAGTGAILRHSFVKSQVPLERVFIKFP